MRARRAWVVGLCVLFACLLAPGVAWAGAPEAPVTTEAAAGVTGTTATFTGELNPGSSSERVRYRFAYSPGGECGSSGRTVPVEGPFPEAEGNHEEVSEAVTGLEGSTEYSVCLFALNLGESEAVQGSQLSFRTPAARPVVVEERAVSVTPFDGALEASVNPENLVTTYRFEYAREESLIGTAGAKSIGESALSRGSEPAAAGPVDIGGGLEPSKTYFYRVLTSNATGTTDGPIEQFETQPLIAPEIDQESAGEVTRTGARLQARINPEWQATKWQFRLGLSSGYELGAVLESERELGEGFGEDEVSVDLGREGEGVIEALRSLRPNTVYHYEAVAVNGTGSVEGHIAQGDQTFLTLPEPPAVATGEPSAVTASTARIAGTVNPGSEGHPQDQTSYSFQYGTSTSYGGQTPVPAGEAGEGEAPVAEHADLAGLEPGTVYHYRILASNDQTGTPQTTYGEDRSFTTISTRPVLAGFSVTSVTANTATVTGTLQPENLPTRYELQLSAGGGEYEPEAAGTTSATTELKLALEALNPATPYSYRLTATNLNGSSETTGAFTTSAAGESAGPITQPTTLQLLPIPKIEFPKTEKKPTQHELLEKALRSCRKKHNPHKRHTCEKQARKKYATKKT